MPGQKVKLINCLDTKASLIGQKKNEFHCLE